MKNILILNPFGIGDLLFSTPLIGILKKNFKDINISFVCNKRTLPILEGNPDINNIFVFEKDDFRALWRESKIKFLKFLFCYLMQLNRQKFDLVIDLSLGSKYGLYLKLIGIPKRIGFDYKNRGRFLTHKVKIDGFNDKHVIEYNLDLLRFLGIENIDPDDKKMQMHLSSKDVEWAEKFLRDNDVKAGEKVFGIVPGCGASWGINAIYRRWEKSKFREVADRISENFGFRAIIFGDLSELDLCSSIYSEMKVKPIIACGKTNLKELAALFKRCELVISNDGGPLHIAVSQEAKTVSIFGPVDENVYGPYPKSPNHIVIKKKLGCRPCYIKFKHKECVKKDCLDLITVDEVYDASEALIKRRLT